MFGRSYTDWHTHGIDESLMCQIGAPKQVAIAGPDSNTANAFLEAIYSGPKEQFSIQNPDRFRNIGSVVRYCVTINPGDALYIPTFWWHAVETVENPKSWGATVAICWKTPPHIAWDPRFSMRQDMFWRFSMLRKIRYLWRMTSSWLPRHLRGKTLPDIDFIGL